MIEAADRGLDLEYEIFVCANCGREQSLTVSHNKEIPHIKVAQPTNRSFPPDHLNPLQLPNANGT
jgi:hypothetical protein